MRCVLGIGQGVAAVLEEEEAAALAEAPVHAVDGVLEGLIPAEARTERFMDGPGRVEQAAAVRSPGDGPIEFEPQVPLQRFRSPDLPCVEQVEHPENPIEKQGESRPD
ncbi:MAG: hypothetical protein BWY66_01277 [bacterium ADurb.Bin374]|nr:MAG: hypothetical protein BWY66_01277 [bacterium ADurb.Bin374]